uniref:TGc domain-containing protein n=1 Tax=Macrostomum lignano TaxID=282301 RepID=A0A1I8FHB3_9PLAT
GLQALNIKDKVGHQPAYQSQRTLQLLLQSEPPHPQSPHCQGEFRNINNDALPSYERPWHSSSVGPQQLQQRPAGLLSGSAISRQPRVGNKRFQLPAQPHQQRASRGETHGAPPTLGQSEIIGAHGDSTIRPLVSEPRRRTFSLPPQLDAIGQSLLAPGHFAATAARCRRLRLPEAPAGAGFAGPTATAHRRAQQPEPSSFKELVWTPRLRASVSDDLEEAATAVFLALLKGPQPAPLCNCRADSPEAILMGIQAGTSTYAQAFFTLCAACDIPFADLNPPPQVRVPSGAWCSTRRAAAGTAGTAVACPGGQWQLVDACHWAAARLVGGRQSIPWRMSAYELDDEFYFLPSRAKLVYTHLPGPAGVGSCWLSQSARRSSKALARLRAPSSSSTDSKLRNHLLRLGFAIRRRRYDSGRRRTDGGRSCRRPSVRWLRRPCCLSLDVNPGRGTSAGLHLHSERCVLAAAAQPPGSAPRTESARRLSRYGLELLRPARLVCGSVCAAPACQRATYRLILYARRLRARGAPVCVHAPSADVSAWRPQSCHPPELFPACRAPAFRGPTEMPNSRLGRAEPDALRFLVKLVTPAALSRRATLSESCLRLGVVSAGRAPDGRAPPPQLLIRRLPPPSTAPAAFIGVEVFANRQPRTETSCTCAYLLLPCTPACRPPPPLRAPARAILARFTRRRRNSGLGLPDAATAWVHPGLTEAICDLPVGEVFSPPGRRCGLHSQLLRLDGGPPIIATESFQQGADRRRPAAPAFQTVRPAGRPAYYGLIVFVLRPPSRGKFSQPALRCLLLRCRTASLEGRADGGGGAAAFRSQFAQWKDGLLGFGILVTERLLNSGGWWS